MAAAYAATVLLLFIAVQRLFASAPFTPGNLVLYRVGTGSSLSSSATAVFLDEFTPAGVFVQSISLPTSSVPHRLTASGTATSEGLLTRSADGLYLVLTGYDAALGTASVAGTSSATVFRTVGRVDVGGNIDTTTALNDFSTGNNPRGVASSDGVNLWVGGAAGGVRYATLGASGSTQLSTTVTNIRAVEIFDGQLYNSDSSGSTVRLGTVGTGLPTTSGQIITNLNGFATSGSPYAFFFADLDAAVPGVDTLYVADDGTVAGVTGGIAKFTLVGGVWVARGIVGNSADAYRGLTGVVTGTTVTLYATRNGGSGANGGGQLVSIVDASGYNGTIAGTPTLLATAAANTAYRGVALAPISIVITGQPVSQTIGFGATATLHVTAAASGTAVTYQWYVGNSGDTSNPIGGATSKDFTTPSLTATTKYWVRVLSAVGNLDSTTATITVNPAVPPTITLQPVGQLIPVGATWTMTVAATGDAPLSYQWYVGPSGVTTNPIAGANAASFTTPPLFATTSYWVRVSNAGGSADSQPAVVSVPACSAPHIAINQVQGNGAASPMVGQTVTVRGVVVGDYEGAAALRGFYLQDLPADVDADPATSEGVFVFESDNGNRVSLGQIVQVTGKVSEFQDQTEIDVASTGVESCGQAAPVTPTDVTLPVPDAVGGVAYLERFEGMLVRFHQTLFVSEHFQLGRFGQIVMSSGARLPQPTSITLPGPLAQAQEAANDLNQIIVDDEQNGQNPDPIEFGRAGNPLSASNTLRGGDTATNIIGVMTYGWAGNSASGNAYRLRPVNALGGGVPNFQASNPRPAGPPAVGGSLKAVGMNVLNYFLTLDAPPNNPICGPVGHKQACRGANTSDELMRQQLKLNQALVKLNADIVGMSELENTDGVDPLLDITTRLNGSVGAGTYDYVKTGTIGTDDIRVGIMYKPSRVTPIGAPLVDLNPVHNRPPVAQLFSENATGERFTVIVNHFRSKGCSTNPANPLDNDQNDGQSCFNATRVQQSQALLTFIHNTVMPTVADPDVMLIGDFNSYAKEDPIRTIEAAGFTNLVSRFSGPNAYSYVFSAEWGYIDHALVSTSMLPQVTGAGDYHINADEPSVLDYNVEFKSPGQIASLYNADEYRIADHDPVVIGLALKASPLAAPDHYVAEAGSPLTIGAPGVLANDSGGPLAIFSHTDPGHGALSFHADGSFAYMPAAGFVGSDSFTYTVNSASPSYFVELFSTNLAPLATIGGVPITAGAFGSAIARVPGSPDEVYGLTDRGPNVDGPNGTKVEPLPAFAPSIAKFKLIGDQAVLEQVIMLQAPDGTPYSGRVNTQANTGEVITDLDGNVLAADPNGYDSEGLVALADGTFWVSDEYGPFITHFDATGKQIGRLSPFDASLPAELAARIVNRGMEGLTITPDGTTLVGIMQSALQQDDLNGFDGKKLTPLRIVTYRLADGAVHEYLYLLDNPAATKTAVSEIAAVTNTTFVVDERDGNFPPGAYKKLFLIDLTGATDIGPSSAIPNTTYDAVHGGLQIAGKTIELFLKNLNTADSVTALAGVSITPASKNLYIDVGALITSVDPQGRFFGHDKVEGVVALNGGATIVLSNDSDFGIDGITNSTPPFQLHAKMTPAGVQDDGEFLVIDLVRSQAAVTIDVKDTIPPNTTLTSTPPSLVNSNVATFAFTGSDSGSGVAGFECALDGAPFSACASGNTFGPLNDGAHLFAVRAVDAVGNRDQSPATFAWTIDTTAPDTFIDTMPADPTASATATFTFHGTDTGSGVAGFECALDGAAFAPCVTGVTYPSLADGVHVFAVRALDHAGNADPSPASFSWLVDRTPPTVTASADTDAIWPPNGKLVPVTVSGRMSDAGSGIAAGSPAFNVVDEYHSVEPAGPIALHQDGTFSFVVNLEASRLGSDLDGRRYEIVVTASDRAGNVGSASVIVVVSHDQGQH